MNVALINSYETSADRRAFGRRETHMPASVRLPNHTYYDCFIRDISEGGALLEFPLRVELSGRLRLSFDNGNQDIICDVRHTRGNRAGVQFVRNITLAARPVAEPSDALVPAPRRVEVAGDVARVTAASELVALRRKAAKIVSAKDDPDAGSEPAPIGNEILAAADEPAPPRDFSSLLRSVAALANMRAVPRPLPASAYAVVLADEPAKLTEDDWLQAIVPRDMSSLLTSVRRMTAARAVPRPLPASAYAIG